MRSVFVTALVFSFSLALIPVVQAKEVSSLPDSVLQAAQLYRQSQSGFMLPTRLVIPSMHIDTSIESSGLAPTGAVAVPAGPANVTWFNKGVRPGQIGTAIIVGHYGWKDNIQAAFNNLHTIQVGDKIYVQDAISGVSVFVVTKTRLYSAKANVPDVFTSSSGAHLNLITCAGVWDALAQSYTQRLVVFAERAS
ncbi:MAG: class F sortase [Candidatus Paceibacterota bacterium]